MPAVERIILREISLALKEPFRISSGVESQRRILILELHAEGVVGWGECVAGDQPNYGPETIDTAWWAIKTWLAPRLLAKSWEHPQEVAPLLSRNVRGHRMAKAALEMACWELASRAAGVSLSRFLGGTRETIEVGISLGIQENPAALIARAQAALARGYRKVKLKIEPGSDVEYVGAVRQAVGPAAPLMADANTAYTPADTAHLQRLDEYDLLMIEQPLGADDLLRHADLQQQLRTPLCLDESILNAERAADMIRLKSGRIINIKPGRVAGFAESIAIHDLAQKHGVPVWCGGMLESGIGRAHNVALASLPNFLLPGDLSPSERYWERDVVNPPWTMDREGRMAVPVDQPGLGVEVDRAFLTSITTREATLT